MAVRATATSTAALDVTDGPVRTCLGCRLRSPAAELLRVVAAPADTTSAMTAHGSDPRPSGPDGPPAGAEGGCRVVPDPGRRAGGRGAWVHPALPCVEQARRRRAFGRALRVPEPLDPTPLLVYLGQRG
ncbi:MAG: YlxR family protein [Actinobacteria bacterium]|nr:YlxR family protein [Actinomycetota bacterium]